MISRYLTIGKVNLKHYLLPHVIVACIFLLIAPFIMGVKNLDEFHTAKILEVYLSLLGIILLVPVFLPDQDREIRELIKSKKENIIILHGVRVCEGLMVLSILVLGFILFLRQGNCVAPLGKYFYGTIANAIFLGGLGIFVYSFVDYIAVAYMVPILYYILCYGSASRYLGKFYLFSMLDGSVEDKIYLLVAGLLLIVVGICIRRGIG